MKKNILLVISVAYLIMLIPLCAEDLSWEWASRGGGAGGDNARGIATDSEGSQYVCGLFEGTATFGSTSLTSSGSYDVWLAKMDISGNWLWAIRAGGTGSDIGESVAVDGDNNIYVAGTFEATAEFGSTSFTSSGYRDTFVAKIDSNGNWLWAAMAGGTSDQSCHGIAGDSVGNFYVTGGFVGTSSFGPYSLTSVGYGDIYVAKLSPEGDWLWARRGGGTNSDACFCVTVDNSSNVYLGGSFYETATFGATPSLTAVGSMDVFVAKLDTNGNWLWAKRGGGSSYEDSIGIATDADANVYLTGYFNGNASTTFGSTTLTGSGGNDIFVAKLNSTGNWLWAIKMGGTDADYTQDIVVDNSSTIHLAGKFSSPSIACGPFLLTNSGASDLFYAQLDSSGNCLQALRGGGNNYDSAYGIDLGPNSTAYICGNFMGTALIGTTSLTSAGNSDIYIAKLGLPYPTADFSALPMVGTAPLAVQFTDLSLPGASPIVSWMWLFGDGSDPSFTQNPSHTYTVPGDYSVTLVVTNGNSITSALTRENYIHVISGGAPLSPGNASISINGDDAVISWDAVTLDTNGQPLVPDYYCVWHSATSPESGFQLLAQIPGTTFTHVGAGSAALQSFYRVTAVKLDRAAQLPLIQRSK
jgi:PKD repeat protein